MAKFKKLFNSALAVVVLTSSFAIVGCGGVSDEEMAELNTLKKEVSSLEQQVNSLKSEKTKLQRKIAEKQAKLDQCAKDKEEAKKNLQKLQ